MAYAYALLHDFSEGGQRTLAALFLADYYCRQSLGAIYGLFRAVQVAGFALGSLISGRVFDTTQSYHSAFGAFLGLSVVATGLIALAKAPGRKVRTRA